MNLVSFRVLNPPNDCLSKSNLILTPTLEEVGAFVSSIASAVNIVISLGF
ncbi:hypothetical protein ABIA69_003907 [Lysinibacillus parviboronicapiens]|uniref:Uncharacterized protein n=1 Tax=Lysinibacillus parviboronicapiens TaxID=436516 RepID=A0ABV2PPQ7_9BACI